MKNYSVVGNKKKVTMEANEAGLKVVGNGCVIRVTENRGKLEIVGNDCQVEILNNHGVVHMVGNNGIVNINKRYIGDKVQLVGPNCNLFVDGKNDNPSYESQLSPFSRDLDDVIESIFSFVMR